MQPVPEQAPIPMNYVQILCRAATVRLAVAGQPPRQQRRCYAVRACTSIMFLSITHREAWNLLHHTELM